MIAQNPNLLFLREKKWVILVFSRKKRSFFHGSPDFTFISVKKSTFFSRKKKSNIKIRFSVDFSEIKVYHDEKVIYRRCKSYVLFRFFIFAGS